MIVETVSEFAEEILRPAAHDADDAASYPPDLIAKAAELGITAINIPEDFDGIAAHRVDGHQRTRRRGAGLRRHGSGAADPGARRRRVGADALGQRRSAGHLPARSSPARTCPQACVAIAEPHALFDPTALKTTAVRTPERLPARRRQVAGAGRRGRRTVHHRRATERQARAVHRRVVHARA